MTFFSFSIKSTCQYNKAISGLSFPSVVIILDSPLDNYAVSEVTKLDLVSCIFADSNVNFLGKSFTEVIPLSVGFSYKQVLTFLINLSLEAIIEGDIALFHSFSKLKRWYGEMAEWFMAVDCKSINFR